MVKIGYDAGHGMNTPGKRTPDGEREWSFNHQVVRAFEDELSQYRGVELRRFDDPTGKRDVPLLERTNGANQWGADYYLSFHHNALGSKWGSHTGVETFIYSSPKPGSLALANAVHPAVVLAYGLRNRGIKRANLHIVRETTMPAVLIEGGFMDSTIDIKKLRDKQVLESAGRGIAQALAKYIGLTKTTNEGELTMAQYEELKKLIEEQARRIATLETMVGLYEREALETHAEAWEWATKERLMNGKYPNRALTREQFASIEYNKAKKQ
ncbi:N-acetylmuramoyl-L-alanine amidase [Ureibacillus xyleni]|uniref:N-acetylmuramoyl-L-alanine amidase n=1 Tax=Ureibacillus xyleni TaxID=614648 RepID=A0A285SDL2_9BACL|nr:N-acetylmuramoyl-L-alanine amidase [Ureibacillus xyleni]SOC05740.1 N-acetylmuramoyl-L-alanine amidase [Ureibacillus xyleni]